MKEHYCSICNKSTYDVDYEYLIGFDHLACHLGVWGGDKAMKKNKSMKIKGWEKISGFTYKGYTIVNPIHNADETSYEATILNLNLPQKPKWELSVLTPAHKFKDDDAFSIIMRDDENRSTINTIDKQRMASISTFRNEFEDMVDKLLNMRLASAPISHSFQSKGPAVVTGTGGIINTMQNSGTNIVYNPGNISGISILDTIKELQKQIDELKSKTN